MTKKKGADVQLKIQLAQLLFNLEHFVTCDKNHLVTNYSSLLLHVFLPDPADICGGLPGSDPCGK